MTNRWQPGRLLVGWSIGVLMTLGLLTATGGWYEYRQLSTAPGSGSPARRMSSQDSACQVDKEGAVNTDGFEVVPAQPDGCYLRRTRIRPWQWADGVRAQVGRLEQTAGEIRRTGETERAQIVHANVMGGASSIAAADGARGVDRLSEDGRLARTDASGRSELS